MTEEVIIQQEVTLMGVAHEVATEEEPVMQIRHWEQRGTKAYITVIQFSVQAKFSWKKKNQDSNIDCLLVLDKICVFHGYFEISDAPLFDTLFSYVGNQFLGPNKTGI